MYFVTPHSLILAQLVYHILITLYNTTGSFLILQNHLRQSICLLTMLLNYREKNSVQK